MAQEDFRYKIIVDAVHGDIGLSRLETALVDTATFQRLRHLNQLGMASMVYPNASHSRFAHSLGVLHMMGRIIDLFAEREKLAPATVRKLRVAALLHDVGHYPYSHLMEYIDQGAARATLLVAKDTPGEQKRTTIAPYPSHEVLTELIITQRPEVRDLLKANGLEPDEIAAIVAGRDVEDIPQLPRLLHSTLDVDRMDYLARDAISTGVPYGHIDTSYILNNLTLVDDYLVVKPRARAAVEHFVTGRYFMFKTVYQHHTVAGFEGVLRNILFLLRQENELYGSEDIKKLIVADSDEFLGFHDGYVDELVARFTKLTDLRGRSPSWQALPALCQAVRFRHPPKLVHEVAYLHQGSSSDHADTEYTLFIHGKAERLKSLSAKFGIPEFCWIWEEPKDIKFEALGPHVPVSKIDDVGQDDLRDLIRVQNSKGHAQPLIADKNSILRYLSELRHKMSRLYVVGATKDKLQQIKNEVQQWLRQD